MKFIMNKFIFLSVILIFMIEFEARGGRGGGRGGRGGRGGGGKGSKGRKGSKGSKGSKSSKNSAFILIAGGNGGESYK